MADAQPPLRILIAGGGTGGHVLPAVAVIEEFRNRGIPADFLWIGSTGGVEREIASQHNVHFIAIQTGKLRRYLSVRTITDALRVPVGIAQAYRHVRVFRPDVVYSTGGAVSVPTVVASARVAPILTHEQTAQVGLANKTAAKFADTFAVGFEKTAVLARKRHRHVAVTGNPVRMSLNYGDRDRGFSGFGLDPALPVLYVTGGAKGASPLNRRLEPSLEALLEMVQIVHQVGPPSANDDFHRFSLMRESLPISLRDRYVVREFIAKELPDLYAITDLVIGRSGAGTISELAYVGLPSILIPLPGTWGDEQTKNAKVLGDVGAAIVIAQPNATPEYLFETITSIIKDRDKRECMAAAAKGAGAPNAASRLADELLKLARPIR